MRDPVDFKYIDANEIEHTLVLLMEICPFKDWCSFKRRPLRKGTRRYESRSWSAVMMFVSARTSAPLAMRVEDYSSKESVGECGFTRKAASVTVRGRTISSRLSAPNCPEPLRHAARRHQREILAAAGRCQTQRGAKIEKVLY
jgi:hypothetical protein